MSVFRDSDGKASMTRTVAFILALCSVLVTIAICIHLIRAPQASVIAASASVLGALVAAGCVAIVNRKVCEIPHSGASEAEE